MLAARSGVRQESSVPGRQEPFLTILLNSDNAELLQQVDARDGRWFFRRAGSIAKRNIEGHDVSPTVVDLDADGVPDFLGGAEDGRLYYLANPRAPDYTGQTDVPSKKSRPKSKNQK